jgi:hypothetical protein
MISYLEFILSQVPESGPGAPKLVQLQAVRDLEDSGQMPAWFILNSIDLYASARIAHPALLPIFSPALKPRA